ncbi:uncharacterized protein LOC133307337 [Gastrolobium bilobum]|uniref:uncharacterized protein LOC133307337 n=1 Tax=Gastrolobium bilobum TaxID=150636 RepID=UPI002AB2C646|nr:uncharacterized protein LOC133307337 [Gastrolobium bilobum]
MCGTNIETNRMSPSMKSKSKSKEKVSAGAGKEQQKTSPKTSGSTNHGSGIPASAYNPILGTFQALETSLVASYAPIHDNSHFPKIDDTDENSSSPQGTVSEYDSVSNNSSCSGESEDPKEKLTNSSLRLDVIPGCDNDRREKIRLKKERKHQRQREKRAQELHDRCNGYLMLRKLEALAQQLVAMGFSSERATLALMVNDGKLEESVSWLFEGSEEEPYTKDTTKIVSEGNLKIDLSEELAHISAMEVKHNCSKQEVERVVVACEGDLQKAENTLKSRKQESLVTQLRSEDSAQNNSLMRSQGLPAASVSMQERVNGNDFNNSKVGGTDSMFPKPGSRNLQSLNSNHPNELTEKRWGVTGSSPSTMLTMAQSMQSLSPFLKVEAQPSALRNEGRMIQQVVGREPVIMMQHTQFTNTKQNSLSSMNSLPSGTTGWYENSIPTIENIRSNEKLLQTHTIGSVSTDYLEQFCQAPYKEHSYVFEPVDSSSTGVEIYKPMGASSPSHTIPSQHHGSWSMSASSSPALTVPPSLGLFSGHQNAARTFNANSHVDWNTGGLMPEFDYTSIDWSLDCPSSSKSGGLWVGVGLSSMLRNSSGNNRMASSCMTGLQNVSMAKETSTTSGLREWTTHFVGKDIFSVSRQFVASPPM